MPNIDPTKCVHMKVDRSGTKELCGQTTRARIHHDELHMSYHKFKRVVVRDFSTSGRSGLLKFFIGAVIIGAALLLAIRLLG